jgi:Helix-turn-helix domain
MAALDKIIGANADRTGRMVSAQAAEIPQGPHAAADLFRDLPNRSSSPESFVDAKQGAAFLRMHPKTLMRLARQGVVRAYSFSDGVRRHWRFLLSELDTWMRSRVNSTAHPVRSVCHGRRK